MDNFKKYLILLVSIFGVVALGIGISYSFYSALASTNIENAAFSGKLDVIYINGEELGGSLSPASSKDHGLSTTSRIRIAEDSVAAVATFTLNIDELPEVLAVPGLRWEVYKNNETSPYNEGTFEGLESGSKLAVVEDYPLLTTDTYFTLYIWLDGNRVGNEVQYASFSATLGASATTTNLS